MVLSPATQIVTDLVAGKLERLLLPAPHQEVMPGIPWGHAHALFHPAYWVAQLWYTKDEDLYGDYRWSKGLREEVIACLLGGHGITSEMNAAAYEALRTAGLLGTRVPSEAEVVAVLTKPLLVNEKSSRYRFPNQKGRFVHHALQRLSNEQPPSNEPEIFRQWLLSFKGIGIKTASWITRNALDCESVAVIDIHVFRAGVILRLFNGDEVLPRDYRKLEDKFLQFSRSLGADPRRLDVLMWRQMRDLGSLALNRFLKAA